jgi:hypothetical protein
MVLPDDVPDWTRYRDVQQILIKPGTPFGQGRFTLSQ